MVAGRIAAMGTPAELKRAAGAASIDDVFVSLARPSDSAQGRPGSGGEARP